MLTVWKVWENWSQAWGVMRPYAVAVKHLVIVLSGREFGDGMR